MENELEKSAPQEPSGWKGILARLEEELSAEKTPARRALLLYESAEIIERERMDLEEASKRLVTAVNLLPQLYPAVSSLLRIHAGRRSLKNIVKLLSVEKRALASFKDAPRVLAAEGAYRWVFGETRETFAPPLEKALEMHPETEEALLFLSAGVGQDPALTMDVYRRWIKVAKHPMVRAALLGSLAFTGLRSGDHSVAYEVMAELKPMEAGPSNRLFLLLLEAALSGACGLFEDQATAMEGAAARLLESLSTPEGTGKGRKQEWSESEVRGSVAAMLHRAAWIRKAELGQNPAALKLISRALDALGDSLLLRWERAVLKAHEGSLDELTALSAGAGPGMEGLFYDLVLFAGSVPSGEIPVLARNGSPYSRIRQVEFSRLIRAAVPAEETVGLLKGIPSPVAALLLVRSGWEALSDENPTLAAPLLAEAALSDPGLTPADIVASLLTASGRLDDETMKKLSEADAGTIDRRLNLLATLADHARYVLERTDLTLRCYEAAGRLDEKAVWPLLLASLEKLSRGDVSGVAEDWVVWSERLEGTQDGLDVRAAAAWLLSRDAASEARALGLLESVLGADPSHPLATGARKEILLRAEGWEELDRALEAQSQVTLKPEDSARVLASRALIRSGRLDRPGDGLDLALQALSAARGIASDRDRIAALSFAARLAERSNDSRALFDILDSMVESSSESALLQSLSRIRLAELAAFGMHHNQEAIAHLSKVEGPEELKVAARLESLFLKAVQGEDVELSQDAAEFRGPLDALSAALSAGASLAKGDVKSFSGAVRRVSEITGQKGWGWTLLSYLAGDEARRAELVTGAAPPRIRFAFRTVLGDEGTPLSETLFRGKEPDDCPSASDLDDPAVLWAADRADASWPAPFRAGIFERRAAMEEGERRALWLVELAEAFFEMEEIEKSAEAHAESLRLMPDFYPALKGMARTAWLCGRWQDAARAEMGLTEWAASSAEAASSCLRAADMWARADEPEEEEKALRRGITLDPSHAGCFSHLVEIYRRKGDSRGLKRLLEDRVKREDDPERLSSLYLDLADTLIALDDAGAAGTALDNLLLLQPGRVEALRMKAYLFLEQQKWPEMLHVVDEIAGHEEEPRELRDLWIKAAEVAEEKLSDVDRAVGYLEGLIRRGDEDPAAAEALFTVAMRHDLYAEAAEARSELARIAIAHGDNKKAALHLGHEADLRLMVLKDRDAGMKVLCRLLDVSPSDMGRIEQWMTLEPRPEEVERRLQRASGELRASFLERPTDPEPLKGLLRIMVLQKEPEGERFVREVWADVAPGAVELPPPRPFEVRNPSGRLSPGLLSQLRHPDDGGPASRLALLIAPFAFDVTAAHRPGGSGARDLVSLPSSNAVTKRLQGFAEAIGVQGLKAWQGGDAFSLGPAPLPGMSVRVGAQVQPDLTPRQLFSAGRAVMLASIGASAFEKDRVPGLVGLAAAACLASDVPVTLPSLGEIALRQKDTAQKVFPRKIRKEIAALSGQLRGMGEEALSRWARGAILSADRYGLTLCGDLQAALTMIRSETEPDEGEPGVEERVQALCQFAISHEILRVRKALGLSAE